MAKSNHFNKTGTYSLKSNTNMKDNDNKIFLKIQEPK